VPAPTARPPSPAKVRAAWAEVYATTPYRRLPWFSAEASPAVRGAVEDGLWPKGGAILDVGCGAGTNLLYLAQHGFAAHGIDFAPDAVRVARERAARAGATIEAREGDVLRLPYPRARFDGALDIGCFHALPIDRRPQYREELSRVLRPGAPFLLVWAARESRRGIGPPHRPSVGEVADALEPRFQFDAVRFVPALGTWRLEVYVGRLRRRTKPWPRAR